MENHINELKCIEKEITYCIYKMFSIGPGGGNHMYYIK